jgi:hypothetical protein
LLSLLVADRQAYKLPLFIILVDELGGCLNQSAGMRSPPKSTEKKATQLGKFLEVLLETLDHVGMVCCLHPQDGSTDIPGKSGDVGGEETTLLLGSFHLLIGGRGQRNELTAEVICTLYASRMLDRSSAAGPTNGTP